MLTSSRLLLIGGTLVCAAAFARCSSTPNAAVDMAGTSTDLASSDLATTPVAGSPTLTLAEPANAVNTGGATVTLTGTNFLPNATVSFGGIPATSVVVVSSTKITAVVPAKAATCGSVPVVVTNTDSKSVTSNNVFSYRTATMTFAAPTALAMTSNPRWVITADLDGKNGPDIVTADSGDGTLAIRLNNGDGTFAATTTVLTGTGSPFAVAAADVNNDQFLDLVTVLKAGNVVKVRFGKGDGTFTTPTDDTGVATGASPIALAVGDLNSDGNIDVLTANSGSDNLSSFLGNGKGVFTANAAQKTVPIGKTPASVILANFNPGGHLDFASADSVQGTVQLNNEQALGSFGVGSVLTNVNSPSDLVAGDFNGDRILDLAFANSTTNTIRVTIGNGDGTFNAAQGSTPNVGTSSVTTRSIVAGDFNLDGLLDLAVVNQSERTISLLLGSGTGTFGTKQDLTIGTPDTTMNTQSVKLATADLNHDGLPDLVSTDYAKNGVVVLLSQCK